MSAPSKDITPPETYAEMLRPEHEFCLRTDSHMAFVKDWDVLQLRQWADAQNEYAILST